MTKRIAMTYFMCGLILCAQLWGCGGTGGTQVTFVGTEDTDGGAGWENGPEGAESGAGKDAENGSGPGKLPEETPALQAAPAVIYVYVCGAVKEPKVAELPEGSRAEDALEAAGGFTEDARRDYVNLAERVSDGQKLYFPTLSETAEEPVPGETDDGKVNINTADTAALCTLPGIGEARARDIIAYREANGGFADCEDIMKVTGIKESVYSKIRDRIKVK